MGQEAVYAWRNRRFQETIPDSEIEAADIVVGFDTSSWILAERAKSMGKRFVLDQSIGHPAVKERIFGELRRRFPSWSSTLPLKEEPLLELERREHALADVIVVPSRFVESTLLEEGVPSEKIRIIAFGADLDLFRARESPRPARIGAKVIALFAGSLTARKGVPDLLRAWKGLRDATDAEIWLVGPGLIPVEELEALPRSVRILGQRSRVELAELMNEADFFVFPSYFEGLAIVQLEALASGLPVIATSEAGAAEFIGAGGNGLIVRAGDEAGLTCALQRLIDDPALRARMSASACESRMQLSWNRYGAGWEELLRQECLSL